MVDCGLFQGDRQAPRPELAADRGRRRSAVLGGHHARPPRSLRVPAQAACGRLRGRRSMRPPGPSRWRPSSSRTRPTSRKRRRGSPTSTATPSIIRPCRSTTPPTWRGPCRCFRPLGHGERREVAPGITASLSRAGHILGSSIARIDLGGTTVVFSGDLGRPSHPILREPEPVGDADWIVVESTYGDRAHDDSFSVEGLRDVIARTIARRGHGGHPRVRGRPDRGAAASPGPPRRPGRAAAGPGLRGQPDGARGASGLPRGDHVALVRDQALDLATTQLHSWRTGWSRSGTSRRPSA